MLTVENLKYESYRVCSVHFKESSIRTVEQLGPNAVPSSAPVNLEATVQKHVEEPVPKDIESVAVQTEATKHFNVAAQTTDKSDDEISKRAQLDFDELLMRWVLPTRRRLETESGNEPDPVEDGVAVEADAEEDPAHFLEEKYIPKKTLGNDDNTNRRLQKVVDWKNQFEGRTNQTEFKEFVLYLLYSSPGAYRAFQSVLKLPNKTTIKSYKLKTPPFINDQLLSSLSKTLKNLPEKAKYCALCIGQMDLKHNLSYNEETDSLNGFAYNNGGVMLPKIASSAYVLILQGLYYK